jgi:hypothetical protein
MLGDFQITALNEGTDDQPVDKLLSEPATRTNAMLKQSFLKSALETSVNAFLINTGSIQETSWEAHICPSPASDISPGKDRAGTGYP